MSGLIRLQPQVDELLPLYIERVRLAEELRPLELRAAVAIQTAWRGYYTRQCLERLRATVTCIQAGWRGYKGRQRFAAAKAQLDAQERRRYFDCAATCIQRWWRGYYSRRHVHDFRRRKAYLAGILARSEQLRAAASAEAQLVLEQQRQQQEAEARALFDASIKRLGHMCSTASLAGIFSPPHAQALGGLPLAGGLPLEEHIRLASRAQAKKLAPLQLPKPAPNTPDGRFNPALSLRQSASYCALREAQALEARVDKAQLRVTHSGLPFSSTLPRHGGAPRGQGTIA